MGFNSWMAIGSGVTSSYLLEIASFFTASGLQAAGYNYIDTDGKWDVESCLSVYPDEHVCRLLSDGPELDQAVSPIISCRFLGDVSKCIWVPPS